MTTPQMLATTLRSARVRHARHHAPPAIEAPASVDLTETPTAVTDETPTADAPVQVATPVADARADAATREHDIEAAKRTIAIISLTVRTVVAVALVTIAVLAVTQGWLGTATEAFAGWYNASVAPHLWVDLVGDGLTAAEVNGPTAPAATNGG